MSSKPTVIPRWASAVSAALVTPSSGKMDLGWDAVNGERPPGEYLNWLQFHTYEWIQYLSDGNFDGSITASVQFVAPHLGCTTLSVGDTVEISGHVHVDDNVDVTGNVVITGNLTVGNIVLASDEMVCDPASAQATTSGSPNPVLVGDYWDFTTSTGSVYFPLSELKTGDRITYWEARYRKATTSGTTVTASLQVYDLNTMAWSLADTALGDIRNNPGNTNQHNTVSITVTTGKRYAIVIQGGGATGDRAQAGLILFDHP